MKTVKHRMLLHHALVIKLTLLISLSIITVWLLSVFSATYILSMKERHRIIGYLTKHSALPMILYPSRGVLPHIISLFARQLPFALLALVLMAISVYWLLYRLHVQYENLESTIARRTQLLNQSKEQAEQDSKRKTAHLTTISHELRTPLSGVLGAIELLQTMPLNAQQQELANTARQCTRSLLTLINDLLDFSQIESGHFSLHNEETALLPLLDQAMQTIQGPAQNKKLALRTYVGPHVPLRLETDAVRLRQILVNLLGNSLKFTEKGGIRLTVKRCKNQLIFAVSDSGKGIAFDQQKEIFTAFYQAQADAQGTGIGLTIASNLANMLGGKLELRSTPGLGTCVSLFLPLKQYRPPQPLGGSLPAPLALHRQLTAWGIACEMSQQQDELSADELRFLPGKLYCLAKQKLFGAAAETAGNVAVQPWRLHILLVDDAVINREVIGQMLISLGQKVTFAASGGEALSAARQHRFDLVLIDMRMPGIDGIACVHRWRQCPLNQDPGCMMVALSANAASDEVIRCKNAGINHYLTKPVTLANLANSISIAAEYQLLRNIDLQAQDPTLSSALLSPENPFTGIRTKQVLNDLLTELEQALSEGRKIEGLLHTLKGSFGQAGFSELLCAVVDMENRTRHGLSITAAELADLRHSLHVLLTPYRNN